MYKKTTSWNCKFVRDSFHPMSHPVVSYSRCARCRNCNFTCNFVSPCCVRKQTNSLYCMLGICLRSPYATQQNVMVGVGPVGYIPQAVAVDRTLVMPSLLPDERLRLDSCHSALFLPPAKHCITLVVSVRSSQAMLETTVKLIPNKAQQILMLLRSHSQLLKCVWLLMLTPQCSAFTILTCAHFCRSLHVMT